MADNEGLLELPHSIRNVGNQQHASCSGDDQIPGAVLVTQPATNLREPVFIVKELPGDKWKFVLPNKPDMCLGFIGSPIGDEIKTVSVVKDDGNAHVEWKADSGSEELAYIIHMEVDSVDVCWTLSDSARDESVVEVKKNVGSREQQWLLEMRSDH
ncbi:hypothetical protein RHS03_10032, partial [Rhizoctonia solani]